MIQRLLTAALAALTLGAGAQSQDDGPMVDASLVSDRQAVAPGETFHIALHQVITEGWHTYWRNPGDSGEATRIFLDLPEGWSEDEIVWPAPDTYALGPLTNYGYADEVTLPVPVTVSEDAEPGPVTISGEATWLVCEDICIPEDGTFEISVDVGGSAEDPEGAALIEAAFDRAPQAADGVEAGLALDGETLVLTATGVPFEIESADDVHFFPFTGGVIDHNADQPFRIENGALRLDVPPGFVTRNGVAEAQSGALVIESDGARRVIEITAEPETRVAELAAPAAAPAGDGETGGGAAMGFWRAALLALIGGLILNLMPCVFPILSMKALNIVQKRGADRAEARALGLIFGAGVIATFMTLGLALVALRGLGGMESWGFQLQEPGVVAALAALMFLIGLNFLGAFEIGTSLQGVGGQVAGEGRWGSFLTGVLAVFVAAPCLAPFMTGALTFALVQPPLVSLIIFACLGVGLALPFVAVSFFPQALSVLPRPGPWMERFKQILAFPMFATGIWLVFVLAVQTGAMGVAWLLLGLLAIGFAVWALRIPGRTWKTLGAAGAVLAVAALVVTARQEPAAIAASDAEYETWSPQRVAELRDQGRPIFIDFTAAWCVTCQVNKLGALADDRVKAAFAEHDVALLRADYTNRDPEISAVLDQYGAPGVPFYLVYPAGGGEPDTLPPLLTRTIMIEAVQSAVSEGA